MDGEWLIVGTVLAAAVVGVAWSFRFRLAPFFGSDGGAGAGGGCDGCAGCAGRDGCGSDNYLYHASHARYPTSAGSRTSSVVAASLANDSALASQQHVRRIHLPVLGSSAGSTPGKAV